MSPPQLQLQPGAAFSSAVGSGGYHVAHPSLRAGLRLQQLSRLLLHPVVQQARLDHVMDAP
eukprot:366512-Chlamydomonas_euryale.AAC.14